MSPVSLARALGCCALATAVLWGPAQAQRAAEHEVKAAYLANFAKFVVWPAAGQARPGMFVICVVGADPFGPALDSVARGTRVDGREVVVRRLASASANDGCRILFVSGSEERRLGEVLQAVRGADVLTVSDMPQFLGRGGMIQLVTRDGRVRFEVNLPPAEDAGLRVRSELLRVALAVRSQREAQP